MLFGWQSVGEGFFFWCLAAVGSTVLQSTYIGFSLKKWKLPLGLDRSNNRLMNLLWIKLSEGLNYRPGIDPPYTGCAINFGCRTTEAH